MSMFNSLKGSVISGLNSYEREEKIYEELVDLITRLESTLDIIISKGNFSDEWAVFEINNSNFTIPLLKATISNMMNEFTLNPSTFSAKGKSFNDIVKLQETCSRVEIKIKDILIKNVTKYDLDELYNILIEILKILASNMNLSVVQKSGYKQSEQFPSYECICKLRELIAKRRSEIGPYLSEKNYKR